MLSITYKKKDKMAESQSEVLPKEEKIHQELQMIQSEDLFCRKCSCHFTSKSEFNQHIQDHTAESNDNRISYMSYIEKYICSSCDQQFEVKSDLIIHHNTVCFDAPYTCKHCKENCESAPFLHMHLLVHHKYSEEMLRSEGFFTDIANNPFATEYSLMKSSRHRAFKTPPEDTNELYNMDDSELSKVSLFNRKSRGNGRKRENLAFNLLDKAHTCKICNESFSRKCVLDIHVQKHVLKKTSTSKSCENNFNPDRNIQESKNNDDTKDLRQQSNSQRAILKPCNVILGSSAWKKVEPKSKFEAVKTRIGTRKSKVLDIFEDKGHGSNRVKAISQPSDKISHPSAWKKIKLRSRIPNVAASDEQKDAENSKKKTKLGNNIKNVEASNDAETTEKKNKRKRKIQTIADSDDHQKDHEISDIAAKSPSIKSKPKQAIKNEEKQVFICELCKREFQDNYKLKRHYLIHTGERPYACRKCKKTFTRDDHMKRHLKKVCSKTDKKN